HHRSWFGDHLVHLPNGRRFGLRRFPDDALEGSTTGQEWPLETSRRLGGPADTVSNRHQAADASPGIALLAARSASFARRGSKTFVQPLRRFPLQETAVRVRTSTTVPMSWDDVLEAISALSVATTALSASLMRTATSADRSRSVDGA